MRNKFYGYYTPTTQEFTSLWNSCTFVFDTNTLLNLYRYTDDTYNSFVTILNSLAERIWIPYKVADEFHMNRLNCISDQRKAYDYVLEAYDKILSEFSSRLNKYKQHKFIDVKKYKSSLEKFIDGEKNKVNTSQKSHPDFVEDDSVLETISNILEGKIGDEYSDTYLQEIYSEGKTRYDNKIPPGYMDTEKSNDYRQYGDLIIWKDIINRAKKTKTNIIFITSDNKEDWWLKHSGKDLGPRPELIQEFKRVSGHDIYIYNPAPFIKYASKHLNKQTAKKVLDEIENVRRTQDIDYKNLRMMNYKNELERSTERQSYIDPPELKTSMNIRKIYHNINIYEEEKFMILKRIQKLEDELQRSDLLLEMGLSDKELTDLDDRNDKISSRIIDYQYDIHEIEQKISDLKNHLELLSRPLLSKSNRQEDIPF